VARSCLGNGLKVMKTRSLESEVWVVGEALIDFIEESGSISTFVGGGPANTAKALAMLGQKVAFVGGISTDHFGRRIAKELSGVNLAKALHSHLPTATAKVSLEPNESAKYEFQLIGTATFDFRRDWLPKLDTNYIYIGSLATVIQPGAEELLRWASQLDSTIVYDPNVRPSALSDRGQYRETVEKWASISSIVKLSEDDLSWLGYQDVSHFFALGVSLVVLTSGETGLSGITPEGSVSVPGVKVDVIDTVGAGDTVGAVIVQGLVKYGLETLIEEKLFEVLSRAAKAAAITCTRVGAKPPTLSELDA